MKDKVIITVAPVGALTFIDKAQYLPITPEEIAQEAYRSYQAGASIVHIHSRDEKTKLATPDLKVYNEIVRRIKEKCDMITQIGGGIGAWYDPATNKPTIASDEQKLALLNIDPKPDMLTVNMGTFDFILPGYAYQTFDNTPDFQKKVIKGIIEKKLGVEFEIYDVSHLYNAFRLAEEGAFDKDMPFDLDYVMGIAGGMPATPRQLLYMSEEGKRLFPKAKWQALGLGANEFPMVTLGMILGCDLIRIGMEDNIWLSKGVPVKSNAELVEKAARIARELGREPATVKEAEEILHLQK
jgi:3-keto-5-aminohexanoate cleavage enzyme